MPRPDKVQEVEEIRGRFDEADAALLTEYRGLSVGDIAEVRGALRDAGAEYKVLKNTLARLAVREVGLEELVEMLTGPTAIAFIKGDAVEAAKALDDAAKKFPVLVIKGGVMQGKVIDADQARALAKLESREILLSKIAMLVNSPAQQAVNVFAALLRDLGSMLAQVVEQKNQQEPDEAPPAAPEADEAAQPEATAEEVTEEETETEEEDPAAEAETETEAEAPTEEE